MRLLKNRGRNFAMVHRLCAARAAQRMTPWMHQITKADIVISVGRGLIMAAAIIGAVYCFGNWYFGGDGLDAWFHPDDQIATSINGAVAPSSVTQ